MQERAKFLWISASPSLKQFHRRLLNVLSATVEIEFWEYIQTLDEGSSIDKALELLHEYLVSTDDRVNLIGHGIGGVIALEYARQYPDRVTSLTLLSVAVQPAITWHSFYYSQLRSAPSDRYCVLRSIAINLFPYNCLSHIYGLVERLDRDLVEAPSNHSLFHLDIMTVGGVKMPLMICGSQTDPVVTESALSGWNNYLKPVDVSRSYPTGGHFFHHFHPELVGHHIQIFWQESGVISHCDCLLSLEIN
jgi:pimeloyl-ACP methyl ester carboxylesterase